MIQTCARAFAERVYSVLEETLEDPSEVPGLEAALELALESLGSGVPGRYQAALLVGAKRAVEDGAEMRPLDFAAMLHGACCGAADATPADDDFAAAAYGMPREVDLSLLDEELLQGDAGDDGVAPADAQPDASKAPAVSAGTSQGAEGSAGAARGAGRRKR